MRSQKMWNVRQMEIGRHRAYYSLPQATKSSDQTIWSQSPLVVLPSVRTFMPRVRWWDTCYINCFRKISWGRKCQMCCTLSFPDSWWTDWVSPYLHGFSNNANQAPESPPAGDATWINTSYWQLLDFVPWSSFWDNLYKGQSIWLYNMKNNLPKCWNSNSPNCDFSSEKVLQKRKR
jgi:hypothetical protein